MGTALRYPPAGGLDKNACFLRGQSRYVLARTGAPFECPKSSRDDTRFFAYIRYDCESTVKTPIFISALLASTAPLFAGPEPEDFQPRRHGEVPVVQVPPRTNAPRALPPPIGQTFSRPQSTFSRPSSTFSSPIPPAVGIAPGTSSQTETRQVKPEGTGKRHPPKHRRHGRHHHRVRTHPHHIITYIPYDPYYYYYGPDEPAETLPAETSASEQPAQTPQSAEEVSPPVVIDLPPGARIIRSAPVPAEAPAATVAPAQ